MLKPCLSAWRLLILLGAFVSGFGISHSEPLPGQIVVDPDHPQWLRRHGGAPVFICGPGDPEDFLYRGTRQPDGTRQGDQRQIIQKLIQHGGNCIYIDFNTMSPHDELAIGETQWVLANPGESYIAYSENLSNNMHIRNISPGNYQVE